MFKVLRGLKNLEHILSAKNHDLKGLVSKSFSKTSSYWDSNEDTVNKDEKVEPAKEFFPRIIFKAKRKRRLNATRGLSMEEIEALPREELLTMIMKLDAHNKSLISILKKSSGFIDEASEEKTDFEEFSLRYSPRRHILLKLYYLGWNYDGYVVQETTGNTIEDHLFKALKKVNLIESRQTSNYNLCGRTDKGVSAFEQVISIDVRSRVVPEEQLTQAGIDSEISYCHWINKVLPKQIRAISWRPCPTQEFSARFDCIERTYRYFLPRGNLDVSKMNQACKYLVGLHDFRNICKPDIKNGVVNHLRRIHNAEIRVASTNCENLKEFDMLCFEISGLSFMWNMVRKIVTILTLVGRNIETPEVVKELLDVERTYEAQYDIASEVPLILFNSNFRDDPNNEILNKWVFDEKVLKRTLQILQEQYIGESSKSFMMYEMLKVLRNEYSTRFPEKERVEIYSLKQAVIYKTRNKKDIVEN